MTCRALASFLKGNVLDTARAKMVEQASLQAIYSTMFTNVSFVDCELLMSELPNLLQLNYPEVQNIFKACLDILPLMKKSINISIDHDTKCIFWRDFNDYDNLYRILNAFKK